MTCPGSRAPCSASAVQRAPAYLGAFWLTGGALLSWKTIVEKMPSHAMPTHSATAALPDVDAHARGPSTPAGAPHRRAVLVTGAGRRLGRETALGLARAGWDVVVHYHRSATGAQQTVQDCRALGVRSLELAADLSDEAAARALVGRAVQALGGRLDAVVNSAALFEHDNAQTFSHANFQRHILSNTAAPIILAQSLHEHIQARKNQNPGQDIAGVVVNMLDQKLWNQNPDFLSYTLSKAALEAAGTMLAMALAPLVRVVGVAPGLTLGSHMMSDAQFERLHTLSPLGRSSSAEDVVAAIVFALGNRSITGTTLVVDGGQHLQRFERDFSLMV